MVSRFFVESMIPQQGFYDVSCTPSDRGVARLTLMVGHTFITQRTYCYYYLMACWFIRAFIYGCFKKCKVRVAIAKLV